MQDPELPAEARAVLAELGEGAAPRCAEAMARGRTLRLRRRLVQASALAVAASVIAVGAVIGTTVRGGEATETVVAESLPPTAEGIFQAPLLLTAEPTSTGVIRVTGSTSAGSDCPSMHVTIAVGASGSGSNVDVPVSNRRFAAQLGLPTPGSGRYTVRASCNAGSQMAELAVDLATDAASSHAASAPSSLGASDLLDPSTFGADWAATPTTRSRPEWSLGDDYCQIGTGQRARQVVTGSFADPRVSSEAVQELSLFDSAADAQELITLWRSSEGCEGAYTKRAIAIPDGFVAEYDPSADGPIPSSLIVQRQGALISVVRLTTAGGNSDEALQRVVDAVAQRF